jgi:hypothetical protein
MYKTPKIISKPEDHYGIKKIDRYETKFLRYKEQRENDLKKLLKREKHKC